MAGGARRIAAIGALAMMVGASSVAGARMVQTSDPVDELRVVEARPAGDAAVLDVIVPRRSSSLDLTSGAFTAVVGGAPRDVTVDRFLDGAMVDVVLDTPEDVGQVDEVQGATAEFLLGLGSSTPVRLFLGDRTTDAGTDRAVALRSLEELSTAMTGDPLATYVSGLPIDPIPRARAVVVVSSGSVPEVVDALRAGPANGGPLPTFVWQIDPRRDELTRTAVSDRPVAGTEAAGGLLSAFDTVREEISGSYRLTVPSTVAGDIVQLSFSGRAGTQAVDVPIPAVTVAPDLQRSGPTTTVERSADDPAPASQDAPDDAGSRWWVAVAIALALLAVVVAAVVAIVRRRSGNTRSHAAVGSTAGEPTLAEPTSSEPTPDTVGAGAPSADGSSTDAAVAAPPVSSPPVSVPPVSGLPASVPPVSGPSPDRRPTVSPVAVASGRTGARSVGLDGAALEVAHRLEGLRARRASAIRPIPVPLLVAVEATASAWIDDPTVDPDEVIVLLDRSDPDGSVLVATVQESLIRALRSGTDPELGGLIRTVVERGLQQQASSVTPDQPDTIDLRDRAVASSDSLVEAALEAAASELRPGVSMTDGIVQRCLLATWAARHGHADGVPVVVSPSLFMSDHHWSDPPTVDEVAAVVLRSMSDALARMDLAERSFDALHRTYRHALRADAMDAAEVAVADRVAALVMERPVLDVTATAAALGVSVGDALRMLDYLHALGWLRSLTPGSVATTERRWCAQPVVDSVTAAFAGGADAPTPRVDVRVVAERGPRTAADPHADELDGNTTNHPVEESHHVHT